MFCTWLYQDCRTYFMDIHTITHINSRLYINYEYKYNRLSFISMYGYMHNKIYGWVCIFLCIWFCVSVRMSRSVSVCMFISACVRVRLHKYKMDSKGLFTGKKCNICIAVYTHTYMYIYILSSKNRLFRCNTTVQYGKTRFKLGSKPV